MTNDTLDMWFEARRVMLNVAEAWFAERKVGFLSEPRVSQGSGGEPNLTLTWHDYPRVRFQHSVSAAPAGSELFLWAAAWTEGPDEGVERRRTVASWRHEAVPLAQPAGVESAFRACLGFAGDVNPLQPPDYAEVETLDLPAVRSA